MTNFVSGQDEIIPRCDWLPERARSAVLPARDCPFCFSNKISPKSQRVHGSFLSQNIFRDNKKIPCDFSVGMELKNEKTERVNENENKENKNVDEFQEYILPQKPANARVKTQGDMKAWNAI